MAMDDHVSSSSTYENVHKRRLDPSAWSDDLYSNVRGTKAWYCDEIKKLKAEISTLTQSIKDDEQQQFLTNIPDSFALEELTSKISTANKRTALHDLDRKGKHTGGGIISIRSLEQFTEFSFDDIQVEVQKADTLVRRHSLRARSRGVGFEVTFLVEENELREDESSRDDTADCPESCDTSKLPKITDLTFDVDSEMANADMKIFLAHVQEERQLQQFFCTMNSYSKWTRQRLNTFHHFQEKYPELVCFSPMRNESTLTICNPKYSDIRFNISWKIHVTKEGQVIPKFDLLPCIPVDLNEMDESDLLKKLQSKFCSLLKTEGIEKSIEVIIIIVGR